MKLTVLLATSLLAAACSSSNSPPGGATDGGGTDGTTDGGQADVGPLPDQSTDTGSTPDASPPVEGGQPVDGGACNSITNVGQSIPINQVAMDPPTATGGTIVDGTYALTSLTIYTGPNGASGSAGMISVTIAIMGSSVEAVSAAAGGNTTSTNSTLTTSGTMITIADTCPDAKTSQGTYTATPTSLVVISQGIMVEAGIETVVESFTKM